MGQPETAGLGKDRLSELNPTFVGYPSMGDAGLYDLSGNYMPAPNARRYEVATVNRPTIRAMAANLNWLAESVGWEWIHARIFRLAEYARNEHLLMLECGPYGNVIRFIPPLCVTRQELDEAIDIVDRGLTAYESR